MNKSRSKAIYKFEDFRLDAAHLLLYQSGQEISLAPKVVETLLALVERSGEILSKDELMEIVWADSIVEESNLTQNLYLLRQILSKTADGKPLIETLKRRGYRFNGEVSRAEAMAEKNSLNGNSQSTNSESAPLNREQAEKTEFKIQAAENSNGQIQMTGNQSPIVGRESEISRIKNLLLENDVRLVTLVGIGGTGKTRLAQAVVQEVSDNFSDGVFFIELAAITNPEFVASTIAQQFGIKEAGGKPLLENLKDHLREKQMLIVADNFEQVAGAAPTIAALLAAAESVKFLITSRMLMNLSIEREFVVPPLAMPEETTNISLDESRNYEAIQLFIERARGAKPNFALTAENTEDVVKICARLDGLPLAIELAAARIKIISPRLILAKLENSLKLLTGGARDLPARQQTVRGTIEWSYNLLTEGEKRLFRHLAVFAGGFTFEAAEAVCGNEKLIADQRPKTKDSIEVLDIITSLIDKSLLASKERAGDEQRFRLLETVRVYALESLEENNEAEALRRSHALYFLRLGEEAEPHLNDAQAGEWLNRLEDEHNNLRAAIGWLFENELQMAARLAAAIRIYLINHSHLTEGRDWLTTALENNFELPATLRFKLFNGLGYLAVYQGDYAAARKTFEEDLAEARPTGDKKRIAESLRGLGTVAYSQNDCAAARMFLEEGLAINRELNYTFGIAATLNGLGSIALDEGDSQTARSLFVESLANFRLLGNENGICYCLLNLGAVAYFSGDYKAAREYYGETVTTAQNLGYKDRVSLCLDGFAALAVKRGEGELAARLSGAAEHLREQIGYESEPIDRQRRNAHLAELETKMDEASFSELFEQGRKLKLEEAVALCL